jgi:hypothetical protein
MIDLSTMSLSLTMILFFLGRVFGGVKVPLRVTFFAWSATLGKILTMDNLRKQYVIVVNWCCMCKSATFSCVGLSWVIPNRVVDLFACWREYGGPERVQFLVSLEGKKL